MIDYIIKTTNHLGAEISNLKELDFEYNSEIIYCRELPVLSKSESIYRHPVLNTFFDNLLRDRKYPYVYWFEVKSDIHAIEIQSALREYHLLVKQEHHAKIPNLDRKYYGVPAMTKNLRDENSRVLYVGKVKKDLCGRLVPHLGYYDRSPDTQGLQLLRWANALNLELEFHYIKLPKTLEGLASYLEFSLASKLKPILGRHRG